MYNFDTFLNQVKTINPNLSRYVASSLEPLLGVMRAAKPGQAATDDILNAIKGMPAAKRLKYAAPLTYLLNNIGGDVQPQGFSWMVGNTVGGMKKFDSNPKPGVAALWLWKRGVRTVISIEKKGAQTTRDWIETFPGMKWYSSFLADWTAPSVEHLQAYTQTVQTRLASGGVATHCWGGTGRTGCFLAAYLIESGDSDSAQAALASVRGRYNTHSVEMKAQYNALARLSDQKGNGPSLTYDDVNLDHAGGHWDCSHGDDGIDQDPGHVGSGTDTAHNATMVHRDGTANSRRPYIATSPTAREQKV